MPTTETTNTRPPTSTIVIIPITFRDSPIPQIASILNSVMLTIMTMESGSSINTSKYPTKPFMMAAAEMNPVKMTPHPIIEANRFELNAFATYSISPPLFGNRGAKSEYEYAVSPANTPAIRNERGARVPA